MRACASSRRSLWPPERDMAVDGVVNGKDDPGGRQVFRSPAAVAIWWVWVLFAVGNLIDLAVQGRDHLSVVAAFILLLITGVVYVTALRPRVVADLRRAHGQQPGPRPPGGLGRCRARRLNRPAPHPVRVAGGRRRRNGEARHLRLGGALLAPQASRGRAARRPPGARRRWRVRPRRIRRGQARQGRLRRPSGATPPDIPEPVSLGVDADLVVTTLTTRAEQAREDEPAVRAAAPVSSWYWPAVAAILIPALALLIAVLA